jgi:hypothetical protein
MKHGLNTDFTDLFFRIRVESVFHPWLKFGRMTLLGDAQFAGNGLSDFALFAFISAKHNHDS